MRPTRCPECSGELRTVYRRLCGEAVEWWTCQRCSWLALAIPLDSILSGDELAGPGVARTAPAVGRRRDRRKRQPFLHVKSSTRQVSR